MLKIKNICAKLDKEILKDLSLNISDGSIHAIMGPNGVGKSTLSKVIMGHYAYEVTNGSIWYNNIDITKLNTNARSKLGIFLLEQNPTELEGVTNFVLLSNLYKNKYPKSSILDFKKDIKIYMDKLGMSEDMLYRDVNVGFSGGEKKKNEILQILILKPSLILLDELDSGLDVDGLRIISSFLNEYMNENPTTSMLIITHYPKILELIKPTYVHILNDGKIGKSGDYSLALEIEKKGYKDMSNDISKKDVYE